jgi:class 3 adenylate cyclase/HAMP domain-containing protein
MFRNRLEFKILTLTITTMILAFGLLILFLIHKQTTSLIEQRKMRARVLSTTIKKSLYNAMQNGRPDIIRQVMNDLKTVEDIDNLDILRTNGTEAFKDLETLARLKSLTTLSREVIEAIEKSEGKSLSMIDNEYFKKALQTESMVEYFEKQNGKILLTHLEPLINTKDCQVCHGGAQGIRGVIRISSRMDDAFLQVKKNRTNAIIISLAVIVLVSIALKILMKYIIIKPIQSLGQASESIGKGNLDTKIDIKSQDEIGRLGKSFNEMTDKLKSARKDLQEKNIELNDTLTRLQITLDKVSLLERAKVSLSKFVPETVKRIIEKDIDGEELMKSDRDVSVLFLDIGGYTKISEAMDAEKVNFIVEKYFSAFLDDINKNNGDINETAGDGLMIIFQEKDPVKNATAAAKTAFAIRNKAIKINEDIKDEIEPLEVNMGINSGIASVGSTKFEGVSGTRWTYTATGSVTNLAARIAAFADKGKILVGEETAQRIKDQFEIEPMSEQRFKNVSKPVLVYKLISKKAV